MQYQAILFDMDGTLLPMDMDEFTNGYFRFLTKKAAPYGYEPKALISALWKGTGAMVRNDGTRTNETVFWERFAAELGPQVYDHIGVFDDFYGNEFRQAVIFTQPTPLAARLVAAARKKAEKVVLATNALFPMAGMRTRLSWMGLKPEDFDLVTAYENTCAAKPNPLYYTNILKELGLEADRCLMIGNDVQEDAEAAGKAGLDTFVVTDCLLNRGEAYTGPQGTLEQALELLENLEEYKH